VARFRPKAASAAPVHREARAGDVRHSLADVSRARRLLGYEPAVTVTEGLARAAEWYRANASRAG
jgi:UDP-N-acetylglucosamine 4-epimerase